jgi:endonuclease/exonuclease/phosphatase family metal-dependent hydrolase
MKRLLNITILIVVFISFIFANPAFALEVEVGQQVELRATNPQGVPLHENPFPSFKGRFPDGATATVTETDNEKHWLKVKTPSQQGWIVEKYVGQVLTPTPTPIPTPIVISNRLELATYNVESPNFPPRDTTPDKVAEEIQNNQGPILWGLEEVMNQEDLDQFTKAMGSNFISVLGETGGQDRLAIAYDRSQLELVGSLDNLSGSGGSRSPLVGQFKLLSDGTEFLFMVNHFNRREEEKRNQQADFVRNWSRAQSLPTIIVGDFNFDFDIDEREGNEAFDKLNEDNVLKWIQPNCLASNTCPATQCNPSFNSILDAVFVSGIAKTWPATSSIVPFDCAKDAEGFPDHRIVKVEFKVS